MNIPQMDNVERNRITDTVRGVRDSILARCEGLSDMEKDAACLSVQDFLTGLNCDYFNGVGD